MSTIPTITEQDIRTFVGEENFQRGQHYFQDGAIFDAYQQGMTLKAHCHGSLPEPYRVQVIFDTIGIADGTCSCPVGSKGRMPKGYYCKHIAALLLTWKNQAEKFTELPPIETLLEQRSKTDLITLIISIMQKQPELEWELLMPSPMDQKRSRSVDPEVYRNQIDDAFDSGGHAWDAVYGISSKLHSIKYIGEQFAQQQDYESTIIIYEEIITGILGRYLSYHDEDSALGYVVIDCTEELGKYLNNEQVNSTIREKVIQLLVDVYRFDVDHGGFGMGDKIPDVLVRYTTAEERQMVAGCVREVLSKVQDTATEWSAKYHRQNYGKLLLGLEAEILDDETFLQICRETNRISDAVVYLLKRGRSDEAAKEAEQADDLELFKMIELFVEPGYDSVIERVIQERSKTTKNMRILDWLKERYKARDEHEPALELAEVMFRAYPSLEGYQEMRQLATRLGRWESLRTELLTLLEKSRNTSLLIYIALDEGEIDKALAMVRADKVTSSSYGWRQNNYGYQNHDTALYAARFVAETQPRASIDIYQQHIERLINHQGRGNYQEACKYLKIVRGLYEQLNEHEAWLDYITTLRKKYNRLRSLKAEMEETGLLKEQA